MGKKGPRAKTKTVLKSVSKMQQFGSMQNFKKTFIKEESPYLRTKRLAGFPNKIYAKSS